MPHRTRQAVDQCCSFAGARGSRTHLAHGAFLAAGAQVVRTRRRAGVLTVNCQAGTPARQADGGKDECCNLQHTNVVRRGGTILAASPHAARCSLLLCLHSAAPKVGSPEDVRSCAVLGPPKPGRPHRGANSREALRRRRWQAHGGSRRRAGQGNHCNVVPGPRGGGAVEAALRIVACRHGARAQPPCGGHGRADATASRTAGRAAGSAALALRTHPHGGEARM